MLRSRLAGVALAALLLAAAGGWWAGREPEWGRVPVPSLAVLERELERLRLRTGIPGMSGAIAEGDGIVWARGFGVASRERALAAAPDTMYHLASLTKPYGSTMVLQLVEEGRLTLEDPIATFGLEMERDTPVRVRHLLSHTSDDPPGARYRYDGTAFGLLTQVVERVTGEPFAKALTDRIIRPLGLTRTAPNPGEPRPFRSLVASVDVTPADVARARSAFSSTGLDRETVERGLAQGYARAWGRSIWPSGVAGPLTPMAHGFTLSATSGLAAAATDVARFSMALDQGRLLNADSRRRMWTPPPGADGAALPYALGWFVQQTAGRTIVWHHGHGLESSALIVKVPETATTFVLLANSDGLGRGRRLGDRADVTASPAAALFLNWHDATRAAAARP